MNNQAKDWQEGAYTIHVEGNSVEAIKVYAEKIDGGIRFKKKLAKAKCAPEDEFSLSTGVMLAMDRLNKELDKDKIEVGDKVRIKTKDLSYTTYIDWIKKNINDVGLIACFVYGKIPDTKDIVYVVKAVAPWKVENDNNQMLAYVQRYFKFPNGRISNDEPCYLMSIDGLEKIYE